MALTVLGKQIIQTLALTTRDSSTAAWMNAVTVNGGSVSDARKQMVDNLIIGLKADGVWSKLDRLWLFAAEGSIAALTDIVGRTLATAINSPTFTVDQGFIGQDSPIPTKYINSNFAPNTGTARTQNSGHMSIWVTVYTPPSGTGGIDAGASANSFDLLATNRSGQSYAVLNDGNVQFTMPANLTGFWITNRTGSTVNNGYVNNVLQNSIGTASGILNSDNIYVLCYDAGGPNLGAPDTIGSLSLGGGLTSTDLTNFFNRLSTYMGAAFANRWATMVIANGGTVSTQRQALVANLIAGLMQDNVWGKLDRLWLMAAENATAGLVDIVGSNLATAVNSPSFTADRGFLGNGTSSYINSGYNFATNGVNYTLNSASLGFWSTDNFTNPNTALLGGNDGTNFARIHIGNNWFFESNQTAFTVIGNPNPGAELLASSRTTSTLVTLYHNSTSLGTDAHATSAVPNVTAYILALYDGGVSGPNYYNSTNRCSAAFFGGGLTSTDMSNIYSRLRTYMTAVGIP